MPFPTIEEQDALELRARKERVHRHSFDLRPGFHVGANGRPAIGDPANIADSLWICSSCRAFASLAELQESYGNRQAKVRITLIDTD